MTSEKISEIINEIINDSIETHKLMPQFKESIEKATNIMISALKKGNKIMICGNGGSASQAQHFAAELVGDFETKRKGIPSISLTADTSNLTSIGNDYGFDYVFRRQIEAIGKSGDILICLSTSGNSRNVIKAIEKIKNIKVINLLGKDGGKMKGSGDIEIIIPSNNTARVQECHILILHIWAKLIEDASINQYGTNEYS